jgi:hypothetical protein
VANLSLNLRASFKTTCRANAASDHKIEITGQQRSERGVAGINVVGAG